MKSEFMELKLKVKIEDIVVLFISACEGGSNYWCEELTPFGKTGDAYESMLAGFSLVERRKRHSVFPKDIQKALDLFPIEAPHQFGQFIADNADASTGDVFLQLCVFKKVIYG